MGQGAKFFTSIFFGFVLAVTVNSWLTSVYCPSELTKSLCNISSIVLVPTATLILSIIIFLLIPNRD